MILLKRLYSETDLFDEVTFKPGINIILGKYSENRKGEGVNGIGKSTLIRLIDFALLSDSTQKSGFFSPKNYPFLENHDFTLEFSMDNDVYRIKRYLNDPSIVHFGEVDGELIEYSEKERRAILGNRFFCSHDYQGHIDNKWFRKLMRFFVKDDVNHHERNDPLNFLYPRARKSTLLVYNLYLLGLPNTNAHIFDDLQQKMSKLRGAAKELEKKMEEDTGKKVEEFKLDLTHIEARIRSLQTALADYKFLETYKDVEDRLIKLATLISQKLGVYNTLRKRLESYQESYRLRLEVNVEKVKSLYSEVNAELAQFVDRTLDEVIQFRKSIAESRKKFLVERERLLQAEIGQTLKDISEMEQERSSLYTFLEEREALDSIKHTYEQLIDEKARMERTMATIDNLQSIEKSIADIQMEISSAIRKIIADVEQGKDKIAELHSLFSEILESAVLVDESIEGSYFDVSATADRRSPLNISIGVPKSQSLGKSRFRILMYDLTVFLNIVQSQRRLPHFLVHDGVFHGVGRKTVVNTLNYIYSQHLRQHNFQYIITANEEELYIPPEERAVRGDYNFDWKEMKIAEYEDIPEKMIFRRNYT